VKILVISATQFEIIPLLDHLNSNFTRKSFFEYTKDQLSVRTLVTGVGSMLTSLGICRLKGIEETDLLLNLGLAGSFCPSIKIGNVVEINKDRFADLGVEEQDGSFTDVHELDLINKDFFPFKDGWIENESKTEFKSCQGITVNKVHGSANSIDLIKNKYHPEVESMEGAAFMYASKILDINCIQLRSISNYVEPRNKDRWQIDHAIDRLNESAISFLDQQN